MFGSTIDYQLLRPFTHSRNFATEEEIDARTGKMSIDLDAAASRILKLQKRLRGRLPIEPDFRYLDIGCGGGDIALGLAQLGAGHVTGIDIVPRYISAATANADRLQLTDRVQFLHQDIHHWAPSERYDVVLSHEALEHIRDPQAFLRVLKRFVRPHGIAVLAFGPLFHSPVGDHMDGFFRMPIPWRGALFSEKAILRLRAEKFRPTEGSSSYHEIVGGLNLLRYSEFLRYTAAAGWQVDFLDVNPQLRKIPPLYWLSSALCRLPGIQNYFAGSVYTILRHDPDWFARAD
ncbi:MAG TPA: class I SAM-dependent methyltransferase [Bryobacteraceae bacterium]|nr:class I SAM-dependent methyltransferase [Bryobacteraceae bacterium]